MYRYKVGMYGGSFDPLHIGHIHDIIRAAAMCEELYVMISWCEGRESASKEQRYRWILNSTRHLPNVKIIMIEDKAVSKEEYNTDYYWEKGAQDIKDTIGKPIDAVFCGSDYLGTGRFESLYCPESEVVYFDRAEVPVSSTEIREWATAHWEYIPEVCRDHYIEYTKCGAIAVLIYPFCICNTGTDTSMRCRTAYILNGLFCLYKNRLCSL